MNLHGASTKLNWYILNLINTSNNFPVRSHSVGYDHTVSNYNLQNVQTVMAKIKFRAIVCVGSTDE